MKKTESKGTIQELCEQATERVYARAAGQLLVHEAIGACYAVPRPDILRRLDAQRNFTPAVRLSVPLLPDKAEKVARRTVFAILYEQTKNKPGLGDSTV